MISMTKEEARVPLLPAETTEKRGVFSLRKAGTHVTMTVLGTIAVTVAACLTVWLGVKYASWTFDYWSWLHTTLKPYAGVPETGWDTPMLGRVPHAAVVIAAYGCFIMACGETLPLIPIMYPFAAFAIVPWALKRCERHLSTWAIYALVATVTPFAMVAILMGVFVILWVVLVMFFCVIDVRYEIELYGGIALMIVMGAHFVVHRAKSFLRLYRAGEFAE